MPWPRPVWAKAGALVMVFGLNGVGLAVIRDGDLGILVSKFVSNY